MRTVCLLMIFLLFTLLYLIIYIKINLLILLKESSREKALLTLHVMTEMHFLIQKKKLKISCMVVKEIIDGDARLTVRDIARNVGISLSMVHLILKKHLKVRKIFARWVPHLLTDKQNRQRDKVAKNMLQMFQTCDKKQFVNVVTGGENWIYNFEPVRKFSNEIWASKYSRPPIIAKRSFNAREVWYAIFFSGEGVAIKVLNENGNKHHQKALQRHSTGEAEKNIRNDALSLV